MEINKFKTNVENEQALSRVTPYLDKEESSSRWKCKLLRFLGHWKVSFLSY
jgi:hypothetical protein